MHYEYKRYAVSWVPSFGDAYHQFGFSWTGWCSEAGEWADVAARAQTAALRSDLPMAICDRGLFGNIRSPFRLATGRSWWALDRALDALARQTRSIALPGVKLCVDSGRVGWVSAQRIPALKTLLDQTARAVRLPQAVPAPAHPSIDAKAKHIPIEDRSHERFFIPLTDELEPMAAKLLTERLQEPLSQLMRLPLEINDLALMGDPGGGRPWRLVERYHLSGGIRSQGYGQALEVIG